jgi:hypothetical protein
VDLVNLAGDFIIPEGDNPRQNWFPQSQDKQNNNAHKSAYHKTGRVRPKTGYQGTLAFDKQQQGKVFDEDGQNTGPE